MTFTVTRVAVSGSAYSAAQNHDADADSTGTAISIAKPVVTTTAVAPGGRPDAAVAQRVARSGAAARQ
jgi:hypothetical protein